MSLGEVYDCHCLGLPGAPVRGEQRGMSLWADGYRRACLAMLFSLVFARGGLAQEPEQIPAPVPLAPGLASDPSVQAAPFAPAPSAASFGQGCSACASGQRTCLGESWFDARGGCEVSGQWRCAPGRTPCPPCEAQTPLGCLFYRIYESLCCVDPCYEPRWLPITDAAFFVDPVRPMTQLELRWDSNLGMSFPDRSEYFWARSDGKGRGPHPPAGVLGESSLRYNELTLYTEAAVGAGGVFVAMPYRAVYPETYAFGAGFADMCVGTKSVLVDSDFLLCGFQFRTFIPIGLARRGLGTGHVSLEPSLLVAMKFTPELCLQGQLSEWIPIAGDRTYQGSILHYHLSMNRVLGWIYCKDPVVGTLEFNGWSFQTGAYTDPFTGQPARSSGETYASLGCGLRMFLCDRMDLGFGAAFGVTHECWAEQLYTVELRSRF